MGFYGMCSTAPDKDYFYYVSQAILKKNPSAVFSKTRGSSSEQCEDASIWRNIWENTPNPDTGGLYKDSFTEDVDLIFMQINDNINTEKKLTAFHTYGDELVKEIRICCPRARIIWVHGWYNEHYSGGAVNELCLRHNIQQVCLQDLNRPENQATAGQQYVLPDGTLGTVKDNWLTHPGDEGMKKIAARLLQAIGIE